MTDSEYLNLEPTAQEKINKAIEIMEEELQTEGKEELIERILAKLTDKELLEIYKEEN